MKSITAIFAASCANSFAANCDQYNNSRDLFSVQHWEDSLRNQSKLELLVFYRERQEVLRACQLDSFSRRNVEHAVQEAKNLIDKAESAKPQ